MADLHRGGASDALVTLDQLIDLVHDVDPAGGELEHVRGAVALSERLGELGDHLIGHFVDEARHAGASWRAIGESLGVSKQAAQQRFVPEAGDLPTHTLFARFTPRARNAVRAASDEARKSSARQVGTEHLVLGLLTEPQGIAAEAIVALGATSRKIRQRVGRGATATASSAGTTGAAPDGGEPEGRIPFSPAAKQALKLALREALRRGHNYIGTEHLLLGILSLPDDAGATVLADVGVTREGAEAWIGEALAKLSSARQAATQEHADEAGGAPGAGDDRAGAADASEPSDPPD